MRWRLLLDRVLTGLAMATGFALHSELDLFQQLRRCWKMMLLNFAVRLHATGLADLPVHLHWMTCQSCSDGLIHRCGCFYIAGDEAAIENRNCVPVLTPPLWKLWDFLAINGMGRCGERRDLQLHW